MADEVTYLAGGAINKVKPLPPYNEKVCQFLNALSEKLLHDKTCKEYPDITAAAFWMRRGNIEKLKKKNPCDFPRIGRGLAFHITPSNIPVQFIFSYAFGLLAGNANIVRVTSKNYPQIDLICSALNEMLQKNDYIDILNMTSIVRYSKESNKTKEYSERCQVRLIWGGDDTVSKIREYKISPKATDITFPDRYSLAVINSNAVAELNDAELNQLARNFYNDTFLMDQNACSSPQLILWSGDKISEAKKNFWQAVENLALKRYPLVAAHATEKYFDFCCNAIQFPDAGILQKNNNYLYRVQLKNLFKNVDELRGKFGLFYEYDIKDLSELNSIVTEKYQTLTYFGFNPEELSAVVVNNSWLGVDRIVPVGAALDINIFWDGYDLINQMSRIIYLQ